MADSHSNTIRFADRITASGAFRSLYADGMILVEEAANYLDSDGRAASKDLPRIASVLYAAESMRLTTRLMQMASWLLLQRAVNTGEMSREQVIAEQAKVRLDSIGCDQSAAGWADLPKPFRDLIERSLRLQSRIALLDDALYRHTEPKASPPHTPGDNSVLAQLSLLETAFGRD